MHGPRRPPHVDFPETPYFVSTRTHRSTRVFVGDTAATAVDELLRLRRDYSMLLFAFVFMPDHAHFVLVPLDGHTLGQTMRLVKGSIARRVNVVRHAPGTRRQEGFYDKIARTREQLNTFIEYVHENPVAA